MDEIQFIAYESARQEVYKRLSACFYPPGSNMGLTLELLGEAIRKLNSEAGSYALAIGDAFKNANGSKPLRVDFAKLFVGPYRLSAPPYGSVYLEGGRKIMGHSTVHAVKLYREAGLVQGGGFRDAPDHVAVELEFMYYLIFKEIEAIQAGDREVAVKFNDRQYGFLEKHLGSWVFPFTDLIESRAETEFYRNLASILRIFIAEELAVVSRCGAESVHA